MTACARRIQGIILFFLLLAVTAFSQRGDSLSKVSHSDKWSYHFQYTNVMQGHGDIHAPYSGQNSLSANPEQAFSLTSSLYLGRKLWKGASVFYNPEVAGGKGMSSTLGVAGFPNGETFRIGDPSPTLYVARFFIRQHIALKSAKYDTLESCSNQLGGECVPSHRITITAGKISLADLFDNNAISHDPRRQFMNWALMNNGAWDYPANTRGYTEGIVVEFITPSYAVRLAETLMSTVANGEDMNLDISHSRGETLELEKDYKIKGQKGAVRLLLFHNISHAGSYETAISNKLSGIDTTMNVNSLTAWNGLKYGFGVNADQQLNENISAFFRFGWNDGHTASWEFAEIDQSLSFGIQVKGARWKRPEDFFGMAFLVNDLSKDHWDFLNYGGYGFMIGDGKLPHYGSEQIFETYYSTKLTKSLWFSADFQYVTNPAYNRERGPVPVYALRAHVEF
jgi:high affinity Mn2+ porin